MPDWNDRLASLAIGGANTSAHDFRSEHGSVSSGDDLYGIEQRASVHHFRHSRRCPEMTKVMDRRAVWTGTRGESKTGEWSLCWHEFD